MRTLCTAASLALPCKVISWEFNQNLSNAWSEHLGCVLCWDGRKEAWGERLLRYEWMKIKILFFSFCCFVVGCFFFLFAIK